MTGDANRDLTRQVVAEAIGRLGADTEPHHVDEYLALIVAVKQMESETRSILHDAVNSARGAGATWSTIGATLGMSKQAAQKRFHDARTPAADDLDPDERILGPVTAFDEMAELELAGRYGWHSVDFGPYFHRVVHSDTQWEHKRISMLRLGLGALRDDGWQVIRSQFPFTYLKRDLGVPALPDDFRASSSAARPSR